jgi:hypothetical protein
MHLDLQMAASPLPHPTDVLPLVVPAVTIPTTTGNQANLVVFSSSSLHHNTFYRYLILFQDYIFP